MICAFEGRSMLSVLRRLCGHVSTAPSVVSDQSMSRIRAPISPPPARNGKRELVFSEGMAIKKIMAYK